MKFNMNLSIFYNSNSILKVGVFLSKNIYMFLWSSCEFRTESQLQIFKLYFMVSNKMGIEKTKTLSINHEFT
jgi:hypothetical protein